MFNQDIKERYLQMSSKSELTKKKIMIAFNSSQSIEEKYNTDLSSFTLKQAMELDKKFRLYYEDYFTGVYQKHSLMLVSIRTRY